MRQQSGLQKQAEMSEIFICAKISQQIPTATIHSIQDKNCKNFKNHR
jgi:hypothetical protein